MSEEELASLKELLVQRINNLESKIDQRFEAIREAVNVAFAANERRLDTLNNLHAFVAKQQANFVTIETYSQRHDDIDRRLRIIEAEVANFTGRIWAMGIIVGIIAFVLNYLKR